MSGSGAADVIVVAAGASRRMGGIDKVLAPLGGRPMLAWTIDAFGASEAIGAIVVVAAADRVDAIGEAPWLPTSVTAVVPGGDRRQASVAAGFAALGEAPDDAARVVLVHDGARPLVRVALIESVVEATARHGAAIPILPIAETVKRTDGTRVLATVDRETLGTAQTPQGVQRGLLRAAYAAYPPDGPETWTDEAALLEACRIPVHVVPGDPSNPKVTQPADLRRVEEALTGSRAPRVGIGQDSHPFGPGGPLVLGGVVIEGAPRLHGHSDGDVALHAVCDALLGAAGLGDLGRVFPADLSTPVGIASTDMTTEVMRRVRAAGLRVGNIDCTIVAARPRLAGHLDAMRAAIAALVGVDAKDVNVKASTGNLAGDDGAGRTVAAMAIAVLEPGT